MATEQIQYIPLERIMVLPQIRKNFDPEVLAMMCRSLQEVGQLQPIRVRRLDDKFVIVDGELRFRAAKMAALSTLAVVIEEKELCEGEIVHRQLVANCARSDLSPLEKATAIETLMKATGWSASQTAAKLGFSNAMVTRLLALLSLPEDIRRRVESGEIPADAGYTLARVEDAEQQAKLAEQVVAGKVTRDQLNGKLKAKQQGNGQPAAPMTRATLRLAAARSVTFYGAGLTLESVISTVEELRTRAKAAMTRGHTLQTLITVLADEAKREH